MRFLFFLSSSPIQNGIFGLSLRNTARIFCLYNLLLRSFCINNIVRHYLGNFEDSNKDKEYIDKYTFYEPTGIMLLINNSIFLFASLLILFSTISNKNFTCAFLGNVMCSINLLIDLALNLILFFIEKPNFNIRVIKYENFYLLFMFNYIFYLGVISHYIVHSFVENLLDNNIDVLDYTENKFKLENRNNKKENFIG